MFNQNIIEYLFSSKKAKMGTKLLFFRLLDISRLVFNSDLPYIKAHVHVYSAIQLTGRSCKYFIEIDVLSKDIEDRIQGIEIHVQMEVFPYLRLSYMYEIRVDLRYASNLE